MLSSTGLARDGRPPGKGSIIGVVVKWGIGRNPVVVELGSNAEKGKFFMCFTFHPQNGIDMLNFFLYQCRPQPVR